MMAVCSVIQHYHHTTKAGYTVLTLQEVDLVVTGQGSKAVN